MASPYPAIVALAGALALACAGSNPPDRAFQEARSRGRLIYLDNCAPCHGARADGNGPQSGPLDPKPRDHSDPAWRATVSESTVFDAIHQGVPGSAMPAWDVLPEEQIRDLTTYVLSVAEHGPWIEGEDPAAGVSL